MNPLKQALSFSELMSDWLGDGCVTVAKDQAQSRANVCLKCPMNNMSESVWSKIKGKVADIVRHQIELKNSMRLRVNGEKSLGICDACHCILRLKVHVPIQHIKDNIEEGMVFHPDCWIPSETNQ